MNEYVAGFLTGSLQTIIGHPFDTIKVRMQTNQKSYLTTGLFKGIQYPLWTNGLIGTASFGVYHHWIKNNDGFNGHLVGSMLAGVTSGLVSSPIELWKIQKQINSVKLPLYRGLHLTVMREVIALPGYFLPYEYMNYHPLIKGGVAGMISWFISYPIDVIKTRVQSTPDMTTIKAIRMGNMFNGLSFCLARAALVNGFAFWCYEVLTQS